MRPYFLVVFLFASLVVALANDSSMVGQGGHVVRLAGATTVRMVREWVNIDVQDTYYDVKAEFIFHNEGKATTVQMGFPESGGGEGVSASRMLDHSGFISFATWVDGNRVTATRLASGQGEDYNAFWVKEVTFAANQTRRTRVEYRSPFGAIATGEKMVAYAFTGGTWAGMVDSSDLTVTFAKPGVSFVTSRTSMSRSGNSLSAHWGNWKAEYDFTLDFSSAPSEIVLMHSTHGSYGWIFAIPGAGAVKQEGIKDGTGPAIALLRDNVACIPLRDVERYYSERAMKFHHMDSPRVSWDNATKEASITVGGKKLSFKVGSQTLQVGDRAVPLAVAPFIYNEMLFIPLRPILDELGGNVSVDIQNAGSVQAGTIGYELKDYWDVVGYTPPVSVPVKNTATPSTPPPPSPR